MRLTFSTPGTWTAWMPASPCVSRLQGSCSSVTASTDQKYELRNASTSGIVPGAKRDAENLVVCGVDVHESASNHLRRDKAIGRNGVFLQGGSFRSLRCLEQHNRICRGGNTLRFIVPSWLTPTSHLELKLVRL